MRKCPTREDFGGEFEGRVTSEGHGEARRFTPGGRGSLCWVSVVPIARRIEALEPFECHSASGPSADRHPKYLIDFTTTGSMLGAYSQARAGS